MGRGPGKKTGVRRGAPAGSTAGRAAARDGTFLDFVLDQLDGLRELRSRAMFGGHGLYEAGVFFGIVHLGRLYFRVAEVTRPEYEARGMKPFRPGPRQTLGSYYEVPADVLEDTAEVLRWARKAVAAGPKSRTRAGI